MPLQLLEGMSSRKRRPNWTDQECLLLAQLIKEKKDIIKGKCSTGVSIQDKRQAWEEIAQAINTAFPQFQRTVSDCNKKWENLLAKSREEIKRQKRQAGTDDGLSLEELSTVTQIAISVMNLSNMLQLDKEDSLVSELVESQQDSRGKDVNDRLTNKRPLTEQELPTSVDPSSSLGEQNMKNMTDFTNTPKSLTAHFSTPLASVFTISGANPDTLCSTSPNSTHNTILQERMDLEMSVLRRQEAVLKLQEEYYTLKIKLMKKKMEEPLKNN